MDHFWVTIIAVTSVVPHIFLLLPTADSSMMFSRSGYVIYVGWIFVFRFKGLIFILCRFHVDFQVLAEL